MSDTSARLGLPYLMPSQAQKHVTHNEALQKLDLLVQLAVESLDATTPPAQPEEGQVWALGTAPVNDWAGHPEELAIRRDGAWHFELLSAGRLAVDKSDGTLRIWDGSAWQMPALPDLSALAGVGINTGFDITNRLTVSAPATLLSHEGAGHQLKINKATDTNTASLLFQTGWSGRAEMGTNGADDFSIKVSADGTAWTEALRIDSATGHTGGAAVQADATDTTAGKLLRVGAFGLGDDAGIAVADLDTHYTAGFYLGFCGAHPNASSGDNPWPNVAAAFSLEVGNLDLGGAGEYVWQRVTRWSTTNILETKMRVRTTAANGWGDWTPIFASVLQFDYGNQRIGIGTAAPASRLQVAEANNTAAVTFSGTHAGFTGTVQKVTATRSASSAYRFAQFFSGAGADLEFQFLGDGNATCDGSWTGGGADYAEYFEWADGNPTGEDRRGLSVVLDGDKMRPAKSGEEPVGVISANPSVVGDGDIDRWKGTYLRDDFGAYLWEDHEVMAWTEVVDGEDVARSYAADQLPAGTTVPDDAIRSIQARRVLNPDYDPAFAYTPRAERPEWDTVGLMGKLRLRKGQPVGTRWVKMREISEAIEEWLVR